MSLYKRGNIWWCSWEIDGRPVAETTHTRDQAEAQEYHDQRRAELWRERRLDKIEIPTWDTACLAWLEGHARDKKSYSTDLSRLRWVNPRLTGRKLDKINNALLTEIRDECLKGAEKPRARSTCNKHLAVISAVLHYAHTKDWIVGIPNIPYFPEPEGRIRFLTRKEAGRLINELPEHLAQMARFSLATGLRRGNVTGLRWDDVDLARRVAWIWPDEAKAGRAISVPLNDQAVEVLQERLDTNPEFVFTFKDAPIWHVKTKAWDKACKRAELHDVDFHTMRHTWASWHVMAGTPLEVLMQLGGWSSMEMVLRYAHLAPGYLANYAGNVGAVPYNSPTVENEDSEKSSQLAESMGWLMGLEPTTTGITSLTDVSAHDESKTYKIKDAQKRRKIA